MKKSFLPRLILLAVICLGVGSPAWAAPLYETTFPDGCDANGDLIPDGWVVQLGTASTTDGWSHDAVNETLSYYDPPKNVTGLITYEGMLDDGVTSASSLTDYMVSTTGRVTTTSQIGVVARYQDNSTFYTSRIISYHGYNELSLYRFTSSGAKKLAQANLPNVTTGVDNNANLSLIVSGSQIATLVRDHAGALVGGFLVEDSAPITNPGSFGGRFRGVVTAEDYQVEAIPSNISMTYLATDEGNGADAYVQLFDGIDGGNLGNEAYGVIKAVDNAGVITLFRKAYLRFDLSEVEGNIEDGFLTLGTTAAKVMYNLNYYGLNDQDVGENWDESLINYANAPGNTSIGDNTNDMDMTAMTLLGSGLSSNDIMDNWTFGSNELKQFLLDDTDGLVTIAITWNETFAANQAGQGSKFDTLESGTSTLPRLGLIVNAVPEPSVVVLLLASFASLFILRRRS